MRLLRGLIPWMRIGSAGKNQLRVACGKKSRNVTSKSFGRQKLETRLVVVYILATRCREWRQLRSRCPERFYNVRVFVYLCIRSEEHTSELQSLMRISY